MGNELLYVSSAKSISIFRLAGSIAVCAVIDAISAALQQENHTYMRADFKELATTTYIFGDETTSFLLSRDSLCALLVVYDVPIKNLWLL